MLLERIVHYVMAYFDLETSIIQTLSCHRAEIILGRSNNFEGRDYY